MSTSRTVDREAAPPQVVSPVKVALASMQQEEAQLERPRRVPILEVLREHKRSVLIGAFSVGGDRVWAA